MVSGGVLLDTHSLIWLVRGGSDFGPSVKRLVRRTPRLLFSAISIAELHLKQMRRGPQVPVGFVEGLRAQGLTEAPFSVADAEHLARFRSLVDHDPFDRLLLATAAAQGLTLVTADRVLLSLGLDWVLDART